MAGRGILDADMATLARSLRRGWLWWTGELALLVPRPWRDGNAAAGVLAEPPELPGQAFRLSRRGRAIAPGTSPRGRVMLALPVGDVLVREVAVPATLGPADLRRMLALDIDRLTPLDAAAVFFDVARSAPDTARLAVVKRGRATDALAAAAAAGLSPAALCIVEDGRPRFDFLPSLRAAGVAPARGAVRERWWAAVGVLALANVATLVLRDRADVGALADAVEAQQPELAVATAARTRVAGERARRAGIAARRARAEPLAALAAVTAALPGGAWVQRYAWDGRTVRLIGYQRGAIDLAAALRRAPRLTDVRASTSDVPAQLEAGQPFDVTAVLRQPG